MKPLLLTAAATLLLASCASAWPDRADPGAITDLPPRFQVLDVATGATSPVAGPACRSPLLDPRDGTRLRLLRSTGGLGDYTPETTPRYGLSARQALRIDCNTGIAIGAVPGPR